MTLTLPEKLLVIADKNNLPANHEIRNAAQNLSFALNQDKNNKDFVDNLINAQSEAFAAYFRYTGKMYTGK